MTYLHGYKSVVHHDLLRQATGGETKGGPTRDARQGTYKSAPMVALYWLLNRLLTYWFMSEVLPTLPTTTTPTRSAPAPPSNQTDDIPAITKDDNLCNASVVSAAARGNTSRTLRRTRPMASEEDVQEGGWADRTAVEVQGICGLVTAAGVDDTGASAPSQIPRAFELRQETPAARCCSTLPRSLHPALCPPLRRPPLRHHGRAHLAGDTALAARRAQRARVLVRARHRTMYVFPPCAARPDMTASYSPLARKSQC